MFRSYRDLVRTPKNPVRPKPTIYNCNMCDKGGWLTENDVEIHKKHEHFRVMNEYKTKYTNRFCTICMSLQDSHNDLISHIKTHHLFSSADAQRIEQIIYICDECTHIFFNKDILIAHMLYAHLSTKKSRQTSRFTCPVCFKRVNLKSIWFHLQNHEIPSVSLCDICLTNFPNRAELRNHITSHKGYFRCEPCGYNSAKNFKYELHLRMHTLREVPRHKVSESVLNSIFKKHGSCLSRYNMHNTIKGLNLPHFVEICTLCREICLSRAEMKTHVLRDHIFQQYERKKHVCACGEEFYNKVVLKQHVWKLKGSHRPVDETVDTYMFHHSEDESMDKEQPASNQLDNELTGSNTDKEQIVSDTLEKEKTGSDILEKEQPGSDILNNEETESNEMDKEQTRSNELDKEPTESNTLSKKRPWSDTLEKEKSRSDTLNCEQTESNTLEENQTVSNTLDIEQIRSNTLDKEQTGFDTLDKEQTGSITLDKEQTESNTLDKEQTETDILDKEQAWSITVKQEKMDSNMIEIEILGSIEFNEVHSKS